MKYEPNNFLYNKVCWPYANIQAYNLEEHPALAVRNG
jgi:hypothetical protein